MINTLKALLMMAGIFALVELGLLLHSTRLSVANALTEATETMEQACLAVTDLRGYTAEQMTRLRDPRNSKAIDAGLQTLAVYNGTGRLLNKVVIPRALTVLDGLAESSASLNHMIQQTDRSINAEITPEAVRSIQSTDAALKELSKTLSDASGRANVSLDDIHRLLSDPSWAASLAEIRTVTEHAAGITGNIDTATDKLPEIAADLEKISKTSQKFAKPLLIARIVGLLSWMIPWLF